MRSTLHMGWTLLPGSPFSPSLFPHAQESAATQGALWVAQEEALQYAALMQQERQQWGQLMGANMTV
jgi:hypothetical protein